MTFTPILPTTGYSGWRFFKKTLTRQMSIMEKIPQENRLVDHFKSNIKDIKSAQDLVNDRRLLTVALSAFGLEDDINNKHLIKKVLEDGVSDPGALANRFSDKRYYALSKAFQLQLTTSPTSSFSEEFVDSIITKHNTKRFAAAVGAQDNNMRLALNVKTGLDDIVKGTTSQTSQWFKVMGNPPLNTVFQTALNLPTQGSKITVDKRLELLKEASRRVFKTDNISDLNSQENQEKLIRLFLIRSQNNLNTRTTSGNIALTLLRST